MLDFLLTVTLEPKSMDFCLRSTPYQVQVEMTKQQKTDPFWWMDFFSPCMHASLQWKFKAPPFERETCFWTLEPTLTSVACFKQ